MADKNLMELAINEENDAMVIKETSQLITRLSFDIVPVGEPVIISVDYREVANQAVIKKEIKVRAPEDANAYILGEGSYEFIKPSFPVQYYNIKRKF